jgi:multicomponent Na+:H+ antiporter subunit E
MSFRAKALDYDALPLKLLLRLPFYWLWLTKEIIKSGLTTTKIIWSNDYSPELIKIKASQKNSTGIANYANAITLTPGTVTIEIEKNNLLVHALSKDLSEDLQSGEMDRLITGLDK